MYVSVSAENKELKRASVRFPQVRFPSKEKSERERARERVLGRE